METEISSEGTEDQDIARSRRTWPTVERFRGRWQEECEAVDQLHGHAQCAVQIHGHGPKLAQPVTHDQKADDRRGAMMALQ
jgi:hypothetical protein